MKDEFVPIKIKKSVKDKLVQVQGGLMTKLKRKVGLSETVDFLIKYYKH